MAFVAAYTARAFVLYCRLTNIFLTFFSAFYLRFSNLFKFCFFFRCWNQLVWFLKSVVFPGRCLSWFSFCVPVSLCPWKTCVPVSTESAFLYPVTAVQDMTFIWILPSHSLKPQLNNIPHPHLLRGLWINSDFQSYLTKSPLTLSLGLVTLLISKIAPCVKPSVQTLGVAHRMLVTCPLRLQVNGKPSLPHRARSSISACLCPQRVTKADHHLCGVSCLCLVLPTAFPPQPPFFLQSPPHTHTFLSFVLTECMVIKTTETASTVWCHCLDSGNGNIVGKGK